MFNHIRTCFEAGFVTPVTPLNNFSDSLPSAMVVRHVDLTHYGKFIWLN